MNEMLIRSVPAIPRDQPFVLRRPLLGWALALVLLVGATCFVGIWLLQAVPPRNGGEPTPISELDPLPLVCGFLTLGGGAVVALLWAGTGPQMAAGPDGVWVRDKAARPLVVFVPWRRIDSIFLMSVPSSLSGRERVIVVRVRNLPASLGAAVDESPGAGISTFQAHLSMANYRPSAAIAALAGLAAGRCKVG